MIEINLVKGLQESYNAVKVEAAGRSAGASLETGAAIALLRKFGVPIAVVALASSLLGSYQEEQVALVQEQLNQVVESNQKLTKEVAQFKKLEEAQTQLDEDEKALQTKISVINRLFSDRQIPPKTLMALSSAIPASVWLTEMQQSPSDFSFKGFALEFNQVSDFMRALGEVTYFTNVQLKSTQQVEDSKTKQTLVRFEVTASRR